jgi:hypothetical protein
LGNLWSFCTATDKVVVLTLFFFLLYLQWSKELSWRHLHRNYIPSLPFQVKVTDLFSRCGIPDADLAVPASRCQNFASTVRGTGIYSPVVTFQNSTPKDKWRSVQTF